MLNIFLVLISFSAGILLGVLFFGGLWWTIRRMAVARSPGILFLLSWLIRMSVVLAGFYFSAGGQWYRLLACLAGFMLARIVVTRVLNKASHQPPGMNLKKAGYEIES